MADINLRELQRHGPFPQQMDPWAERGRYFHQMHGQMIGYLLDQLTEGLAERGYLIGRESSIQISSSQPDLFVRESLEHKSKAQPYPQAVAMLELEQGLQLAQTPVELDRLFIQKMPNADLVTVVEFISPNNKIRQKDIEDYQKRRESLLASKINVVEIDFTRSHKHLLEDPITENYPYHIVIFPVDEAPYFLGMLWADAPKTFALPLRDAVYPAELNSVYRKAYANLSIALQIQKADDYRLEKLPFPGFFGDEERKNLVEAVQIWEKSLA